MAKYNVILSKLTPTQKDVLWLKPVEKGLAFYALNNGQWQPLKTVDDKDTTTPDDDEVITVADLKEAIADVQTYVEEHYADKATQERLLQRLNVLIGEDEEGESIDITSAIDTFNEIKNFLNGIEDTTLSALLTQIQAKIPKPDWNENDSTSPNYIANRTHYENGNTVQQLDEKFIPATIARTSALTAETNARVSADNAMQTLIQNARAAATEALSVLDGAAFIDDSEDANVFIPDSNSILVAVAEGETTLNAKTGRYYRFAGAVNTLAVTLPAITDNTTVKTIVLSLTTGSTPAVTFSAASPVKFFEGYSISTETTYEISALWNGAAWVVASIVIAED